MSVRRRSGGGQPSAGGKLLAFERPARSRCTAPEQQLHATEATLRATDVYARLMHHRLELARRTGDRAGLGRLDGAALVRVAVVADALGSALEQALAQIEADLATRARLVAETVREEPDREGPR
ncbi:MAG TPA: hypothetical protein VN544_10655 [Gaiellaceae bacterium]|nr:hypothetical protein [Gaiellaceae bacterium]